MGSAIFAAGFLKHLKQMENIIFLAPLLGIVGLIIMALKSSWVLKQDAGDTKMQELASYIANGAMTFLKAE